MRRAGPDHGGDAGIATSRSPRVSIVAPVYNSAQILPELVEAVGNLRKGPLPDIELVLVNDGSRDESWAVIASKVEQLAWVRGIDLARNYGQHAALLCGIRAARAPIIVTIDDDLQHPPAEIPRLLDGLTDNLDVVYGRPEAEQHGPWRDLASHLTKIALRSSMGHQAARDVSAFRAFRTRVRDSFADYRGQFVAIDVLLTWGTTRFGSIRVQHDPRRVGTSNYTFRKLATHALNLLTGFSVLPLQLASLLGFGFTLFGVLVLVWVLGRYVVNGGSVAGFPFLASIIALFSGTQLFALGIIGEYLARIHARTMDRPPYVVRLVDDGSQPGTDTQ